MRPRVAAAALALALTSCTVATPEAEPPPRPSTSTSPSDTPEPTPAPTPTQSAEPTPGPQALPRTPPLRRPNLLARQLDEVATALRDPDAAGDEVQAAGEYQQLAARSLVVAPRVRRAVLARVAPRTARTLRNDLVAAAELTSLADPQSRLPDWRIVAPPAPRVLLRHYRAAERRTGAPWAHLAAIHLVETRMGRIRGTSTAGARGPMQFIPPTWDRYGGGGDVHDYRDAIVAAGRLLRDHGAPRDMANALWHYNPSDRYVRAVSAYARNIAREPRLYRGYWHWRVLYRHERGTYVLPVGYPRVRAVRLGDG
ncbi:MAG TPA: hypothetical protein VFV40_10260 [Nocardioides sp.]|nr:hypothetical protein [Nocardioides sp.]